MLSQNMQKNEALQLIELCNNLLNFRTQVNDKEEFTKAVILNLLGPESIDLLKLNKRADPSLEQAYLQIINLIGIESITIYSNDNLFNDFIEAFSNHAIASKARPEEAFQSIYINLLQLYLDHALPITEQKLNYMKNSNWFSAPLTSNPSTCVSSPRKLLRPEVLAASQPLEFNGIRSASLRSVYPRLLQFIGNLITNLASIKTWPSLSQFSILKAVLFHYHNFLLMDTDDSDFCSLKLTLMQKPLFVNILQTFLEQVLLNWEYNDKLWMCLVFHPPLVHYKEEKYNIFLQASTNYFINFFDIIISRITTAEPVLLNKTNILEFIENQIFKNDNFNELFNEYGLNLTDYMDLIQKRFYEIKNDIEKLKNNSVSKFDFSSTFKDEKMGLFSIMLNYFYSFFEESIIDVGFLERHVSILNDLHQKYAEKAQ